MTIGSNVLIKNGMYSFKHSLKSRNSYHYRPLVFSINIFNIGHTVICAISALMSAGIEGLILYQVPQNSMLYCRYISESADI